MRAAAATGERGAATTELVLLTPLLVVLLLLAAMAGRLTLARSDVQGAARDAARAASLARTAPAASAAAEDAATADLDRTGVPCGDIDVVVDTADFSAGGSVQVEVRCTVPLSAYGLIGGADRTVSATATEVVDAFRRVGP